MCYSSWGHKELVGHDLENEQQKSFDLAQVCMKNIFPPKLERCNVGFLKIYLFIYLVAPGFSCGKQDL